MIIYEKIRTINAEESKKLKTATNKHLEATCIAIKNAGKQNPCVFANYLL